MKSFFLLGAISIFLFSTTACFRKPQSISVIGYRDQMVFLKKDLFYKVGPLGAGWERLKTGVKTAAFHNASLGATISTDAFCGASFEDLPLATLTDQMFAGTNRKDIEKKKELMLDGRGALRTISNGTVDGVTLKFDSVVLKKNGCTIDFVYIAPPGKYAAGVENFEEFYGGFKF